MISHTATTEKIVGSLRRIFARFGCPNPFKSDNGPQVLRNVQEFSSGEWHRAQNFSTVVAVGERRGGAPEQNPAVGAQGGSSRGENWSLRMSYHTEGTVRL